MILWLKVTADRYELPMAVADSGGELARLCGTTRGTIHSAICKAKQRGGRSQYIKVEIEEDEDETNQ